MKYFEITILIILLTNTIFIVIIIYNFFNFLYTMNKTFLYTIVLFWLIVLFNSISYASNPYICWTNRLTWKVTTPDPKNTTVIVSLSWPAIQSITAKMWEDWKYEAFFDSSIITDWLYTVTSVASYSWISAEWDADVLIWKECGVCGNEVIDWSEMCEEDNDCTQWDTCLWCKCLNNNEMDSVIKEYAQEVADYYKNVSPQVVPNRFVDTWPFAFVETLIKELWVKFSSAKSTVYTTLPDWTLDPDTDIKELTLESFYSVLPKEYQNQEAYFHFKWLFVPLLTAGDKAKPDEVLLKLNKWAVLAPETPSVNTIGAVKMIYSHAASLTPSSFAWIGSYISVFWEVGDSFTIYVKSSTKKYEKRTYTIKSKFQIKPEQTKILNSFAKEWIDSYALITCRDGNVLWSTKSREIILADRNNEELWKFHKTMIALGSDKKLAEAKKKIESYLAKKDLNDDQVKKLVNKLDQVANKWEWNPLSVIATYGKYMSAYDAVYNDKAF